MTTQEYIETYGDKEKCRVYRNYIPRRKVGEYIEDMESKGFVILQRTSDGRGGNVIVVWRTPTSEEFDRHYNFEPPKETGAHSNWLKRNGLMRANKYKATKELMMAIG